jgi:hypothetical protein
LGRPAGKVEGRMIRFLQSAENVRGLKIELKANQRINVGTLAGVLMVVPKLQEFTLYLGSFARTEVPDEEASVQLCEFLSSCQDLASVRFLESDLCLFQELPRKLLFQNLIHFELDEGELSDNALKSVLKQCPMLQRLDISSVSGLKHPTISSTSLKYLSWATVDLLDKVVLSCPKLVSANVADCEHLVIDTVELCSLSISCMSVERVGPWNVDELTLHGSDCSVGELVKLLGLCCRVRKVFFGNSMEIEDAEANAGSLLNALQMLDNLEGLTLCEEVHWPAESVQATFGKLRKLTVCLPPNEEVGMGLCEQVVFGSPKLETLVVRLSNRDKSGRIERKASSFAKFLSIRERFPEVDIEVKD